MRDAFAVNQLVLKKKVRFLQKEQAPIRLFVQKIQEETRKAARMSAIAISLQYHGIS